MLSHTVLGNLTGNSEVGIPLSAVDVDSFLGTYEDAHGGSQHRRCRGLRDAPYFGLLSWRDRAQGIKLQQQGTPKASSARSGGGAQATTRLR